MLFESTRGGDKGKTFEEVLLKGLADDGGLYIPTEWPEADISKLKECNSFIDSVEFSPVEIFAREFTTLSKPRSILSDHPIFGPDITD